MTLTVLLSDVTNNCTTLYCRFDYFFSGEGGGDLLAPLTLTTVSGYIVVVIKPVHAKAVHWDCFESSADNEAK